MSAHFGGRRKQFKSQPCHLLQAYWWPATSSSPCSASSPWGLRPRAGGEICAKPSQSSRRHTDGGTQMPVLGGRIYSWAQNCELGSILGAEYAIPRSLNWCGRDPNTAVGTQQVITKCSNQNLKAPSAFRS